MITEANGEDAMNRTMCYDWYKRFKNGRKLIEDDERSGRLSTSTDPHIEQMRNLVRAN